MNLTRRRLAAPTLALVAVLGSCGGGGEAGREEKVPESRDARADRSPTSVIRAWADTLRRGEVGKAASYFALPTVVQNGTPPLRLTTRAQVRDFNAALPCGARLLRSSSSGRFTTAVFRLTERPGAGLCGPGTGQTARTRFLVRDGKIREWRRVADEPALDAPVVQRPLAAAVA